MKTQFIEYITTNKTPAQMAEGQNFSSGHFERSFMAWAVQEHKKALGYPLPRKIEEMREKLRSAYKDKPKTGVEQLAEQMRRRRGDEKT